MGTSTSTSTSTSSGSGSGSGNGDSRESASDIASDGVSSGDTVRPGGADNSPGRATVRSHSWAGPRPRNGAGSGDGPGDSPGDGPGGVDRSGGVDSHGLTNGYDDPRGSVTGSPAVDADRPLAGVRVLVPRTRPRPGLLAARLRALGADAVESVVSRPGPVAAPAPLLAALAGADALVLAGVAEVAAVVTLLRRAGRDVRALAGLVLMAADAEAEVSLEALGLSCARLPVSADGPERANTHSARTRAAEPTDAQDAVSAVMGGSVRVVVCASAPPPAGAETVRRISLLTDVVAEPDPRIVEEIRHGDLHAVAFASSTAARATVALYGPLPDGIMVAAIGRRTVAACQHAGIRVDAVATEPGIHPLAAAVADAVTRARSSETPVGQHASAPKPAKS
ncbi:uroporphyrinogen-III synthase [Frankia sp. CiP1_Cm_nod2]|uniref:uroporphyrinogen-III synthase n=1 Tax=Frankia sp. CiP1_Cm_nod2 TaxID=2897161 RepID=UPI0040445026